MPQAEPQTAPSRRAGVWRQPNSNEPKVRVEYPESDGEPMGETFLHVDAAIDVRTILVALHAERGEDACVGCNNFVYYEEGNPRKVVTPDVFVAYGVPQDTDRRVFKIWEEGVTPDWVLEVTSKSTWREDEDAKRRLYERLGVTEYWQFDPTGDYLDPILKGRALADGRYRELELERRDGGLCRFSEVLGLDLRLEGGRLRFFDPKGGKYLLTPEEQRRALEAAEARIRELERQRRPEG
ncbi:MAG: Uma2 family endonuclease [Gammaproteobacteria bacterium]|nr:Uma2 family endonuclease [Gammaproteobacteria bacterium]